MSQRNSSCSAKLLLFGEYSILLGSSALSIPYGHFCAELCFIKDKKNSDVEKADESRQLLFNWFCFLEESGKYKEILDLQSFKKDLSNGLYLESSIPKSYGLGSSGAVVAAAYSRYAIEKANSESLTLSEMETLRNIFSNMESFFHGISSGIDPLTIFINQPLLINKKKETHIVKIPHNQQKESLCFFLIDTGSTATTSSLVTIFMDQFSTKGKLNKEAVELVNITDECILHFLSESKSDLWGNLQLLSEFQLHYMYKLIPGEIIKIWEKGLESGDIIMKLCGSGGGGYLTAFATDYNKALQFIEKKGLKYIPFCIP
ncbi:MAG: mevalonate kinase family protein [Bacteroidales bacterium]